MNYVSLQQDITNYLHRNDLSSHIPTFIGFAENRLARDLRVPGLLAIDSVTISAAGSSGSLPSGFIEARSAKTSNGELVYIVPESYDQLTGTGTPWAFTTIGTSLYVEPSWTAGGTVSLLYYKAPAALSGASTNWFSDNVPDLLLIASVIQAFIFVRNLAAAGEAEKLYEQMVAATNARYANQHEGLI
jgi:hypothetical protein